MDKLLQRLQRPTGPVNAILDTDTYNEIDVIAMKGLIPYFVSCKNGRIATEELYKLKTVADKFGGDYAKKILITTYIDNNQESLQYIRQRAKDLHIAVIENVHLMDEDEFSKEFKAVLS